LTETKELADWIEDRGLQIAFKWWKEANLSRPYRGSKDKELKDFLEISLARASDADIFILLSEPNMRGTYIELGAFLANQDKQKKVYVVGGKDNEHIFEASEGFTFTGSVDELKKAINA